MKSTKQVLMEHPEYQRIIRAVVRGLGREAMEDVNDYGIGGGYGNFIYYADTVAFWNAHKKMILDLLKEDARDMGEDSVVALVRSFACLRNEAEEDEVALTLYGRPKDGATFVANALAWYAAETVCRWYE